MRAFKGVTLAVLSLAASSMAQSQSLPCMAGAESATAISLEGKDQEFFDGLSVSLVLGLTPKSFPYDRIARRGDDACPRGEFESNGGKYGVYGNVTDSPPRWAAGSDPQRIAYLAIVPPPAAALQWARSRDGNNNRMSFTEPPLYVLATTRGDERDIFAVFEKVPADAELKSAFRDALDGRLPKIATFNAATAKTTFAK